MNLLFSCFLLSFFKDIIVEVAFIFPINLVSFLLYAQATGMKVCLMRLVYYSLSDHNLGNLYSTRDEGNIITNPIIGLRVGAVFGGTTLA